MMKVFLTLCMITVVGLGMTGDVYADKLEEFEELFEEISTNMGRVRQYKKDSRFTRTFEKKLSQMSALGREIQAAVVKMKIEDIDFPKHVNKLKELYHDMRRGRKVGSRKRIGKTGGMTYSLHKIENYLKKLKRMQFSVEHMSYKKELKEERGMQEFERLFYYYSRHIKNALLSDRKSNWMAVFEDNLSRMSFLGREIQKKLNKEKIRMSFSKEVVFLVDAYRKNHFNSTERRILRGRGRSSRSSHGRMGAQFDQLMEDISLSIKQMQGYLLKLKEKEFVLYPEIIKRNQKKKAVELNIDDEFLPAEDEDDESEGETDYYTMTKEDLRHRLKEERIKIYKANKKLGGFESSVVKDYMKTLTDRQKKHFSFIQRKYRERGYKGSDAGSYALIEIHGRYLNSNTRATKKELIAILKKIDKDKTNR